MSFDFLFNNLPSTKMRYNTEMFLHFLLCNIISLSKDIDVLNGVEENLRCFSRYIDMDVTYDFKKQKELLNRRANKISDAAHEYITLSQNSYKYKNDHGFDTTLRIPEIDNMYKFARIEKILICVIHIYGVFIHKLTDRELTNEQLDQLNSLRYILFQEYSVLMAKIYYELSKNEELSKYFEYVFLVDTSNPATPKVAGFGKRSFLKNPEYGEICDDGFLCYDTTCHKSHEFFPKRWIQCKNEKYFVKTQKYSYCSKKDCKHYHRDDKRINSPIFGQYTATKDNDNNINLSVDTDHRLVKKSHIDAYIRVGLYNYFNYGVNTRIDSSKKYWHEFYVKTINEIFDTSSQSSSKSIGSIAPVNY